MHLILHLHEILLNIFGHCSSPNVHRDTVDLAALARTCRAFKEPALDLLWEELFDLSPLARCLPEACCLSGNSGNCYSFSRPLSKGEWNTLRGYTRRVWAIRGFSTSAGYLDSGALGVISSSERFADPLFPNLRTLIWKDSTILPVVDVAVPSLTSFHFDFSSVRSDIPMLTDLIDTIGERCQSMKKLRVVFPPPPSLLATLSRQVCRWTNLRYLELYSVALSMDTILHLSSVSTLTWLSFTLSDSADHTSHSGPALVFKNLAYLKIISKYLGSIVQFFSFIQLPAIEDLVIHCASCVSKRDVKVFWTAFRNICLSGAVTHLELYNSGRDIEYSAEFNEGRNPLLTLGDLIPFRAVGDLHTIHIDLPWSVQLTDADLFILVSTSPRLEKLIINEGWGWRIEDDIGGITLGGLVRLLRERPFLRAVSLAIDTETFTEIPRGLDVWFPLREPLVIDFLDSWISPVFVRGLVLVLRELRLGPANLVSWSSAKWRGLRDPEGTRASRRVWERVRIDLGRPPVVRRERMCE